MKSLVVEDDATQRLFLKTVLGKYGTCIAVETGEQGEEEFKQALSKGEPFQLVCLDILLPGKSGQDLLKSFRTLEERKGIPLHQRCRILMTTGLSDLKQVTEAFASDCDGYLVKPIEASKLIEKLKSMKLVP